MHGILGSPRPTRRSRNAVRTRLVRSARYSSTSPSGQCGSLDTAIVPAITDLQRTNRPDCCRNLPRSTRFFVVGAIAGELQMTCEQLRDRRARRGRVTSASEPATSVHLRSISLCTTHDRSAGHHTIAGNDGSLHAGICIGSSAPSIGPRRTPRRAEEPRRRLRPRSVPTARLPSLPRRRRTHPPGSSSLHAGRRQVRAWSHPQLVPHPDR